MKRENFEGTCRKVELIDLDRLQEDCLIAYFEGYEACREGLGFDENPHDQNSSAAHAWITGWQDHVQDRGLVA